MTPTETEIEYLLKEIERPVFRARASAGESVLYAYCGSRR